MPVVTKIGTLQGPAGGGTSVTITGTNLLKATAVHFGSFAATIVSDSATKIVVKSPSDLGYTANLTVPVTVTTAGGVSATSAADQFTYIAAPTVTKLSVSAGPLTGGTTETITGTNFTGATAVYFGKTKATHVTVVSGTTITATIPKAAAGTVNVTVVTPGGVSAISTADQYTYVAAPTIKSITPATGSLLGGTQVTITGTGFAGATAVNFGSTVILASNFTVNSSGTQITVTSPPGPAGAVNVAVTTVGGTSKAVKFTYSPTAGPGIRHGFVAPAVNDLALLNLMDPPGPTATIQQKITANLMASLFM